MMLTLDKFYIPLLSTTLAIILACIISSDKAIYIFNLPINLTSFLIFIVNILFIVLGVKYNSNTFINSVKYLLFFTLIYIALLYIFIIIGQNFSATDDIYKISYIQIYDFYRFGKLVLYIFIPSITFCILKTFFTKKKLITSHNNQFENIPIYYIYMVLCSVMLLLNSHSICYKLIEIKLFSNSIGTIAASGILFPFTFIIADIVAEYYGYAASRMLIWSTLIAQLVFVLLVYGVYLWPYNIETGWSNQFYFDLLFSNFVPRQLFAASISVFFAFFIFSFLITVIKSNFYNKKFWLRTLIANSIAKAVLCICSYIILYYGKLNMLVILKIILATWVVKMCIATIGTFVFTIPFIYYLKLYDRRIYNYTNRYNIFNLELNFTKS